MKTTFPLIILTCLLFSSFLSASDLPHLSFAYKHWDLVCDNTFTCRAVAYHDQEDDSLPISLLLTRKAGPDEPVKARVKLGSYENDWPFTANSRLSMIINGEDIGTLSINRDDYSAQLSPVMVSKLLAALSKEAELKWLWKEGDQTWQVSDQGATAVLLKMDEFQGRIGTSGALVKKGSRDESQVLAPLAIPIVVIPNLPVNNKEGFQELAKSGQLRQSLAGVLDEEADYCPKLLQAKTKVELAFHRLNESQVLVSALCWRGAYNEGRGFWLVNNKPPYMPVLITDSGIDYQDGVISSGQKGRGLGDCWSSQQWAWDGQRFVHTLASSTGRCTLVAPGGTWQLPTRIMELNRSS